MPNEDMLPYTGQCGTTALRFPRTIGNYMARGLLGFTRVDPRNVRFSEKGITDFRARYWEPRP